MFHSDVAKVLVLIWVIKVRVVGAAIVAVGSLAMVLWCTCRVVCRNNYPRRNGEGREIVWKGKEDVQNVLLRSIVFDGQGNGVDRSVRSISGGSQFCKVTFLAQNKWVGLVKKS